jgi:hypothetical protein
MASNSSSSSIRIPYPLSTWRVPHYPWPIL